MQRWTAIEKAAVILAAIMITGGGYMVLFPPSELVRTHVGGTPYFGIHFTDWTERISKSQARVYGGFTAVVGIALAWFSVSKNGK